VKAIQKMDGELLGRNVLKVSQTNHLQPTKGGHRLRVQNGLGLHAGIRMTSNLPDYFMSVTQHNFSNFEIKI